MQHLSPARTEQALSVHELLHLWSSAQKRVDSFAQLVFVSHGPPLGRGVPLEDDEDEDVEEALDEDEELLVVVPPVADEELLVVAPLEVEVLVLPVVPLVFVVSSSPPLLVDAVGVPPSAGSIESRLTIEAHAAHAMNATATAA